MEQRYLAKLVRMVTDVIAQDAVRTSRDGAYFAVRISVVMGEVAAPAGDPA